MNQKVYQGQNTTALQSQEMLCKALFEMMENTAWPEITIKDLCRKAGLSRQTFYNLFSEKDDILDFWYQKQFDQIKARYIQQGPVQLKDITAVFSEFMAENTRFLGMMIRQGLEKELESLISKSITGFVQELQLPVRETRKCPYIYAAITGALTSLLVHWYKDPDPLNQQELNSILQKVLFDKNYLQYTKKNRS